MVMALLEWTIATKYDDVGPFDDRSAAPTTAAADDGASAAAAGAAGVGALDDDGADGSGA